jgi:hypothetical protein
MSSHEGEDQILVDAIYKHGLLLTKDDPTLLALIRYAKQIGYNEGWMDAKVETIRKGQEQLKEEKAAFEIQLLKRNRSFRIQMLLEIVLGIICTGLIFLRWWK